MRRGAICQQTVSDEVQKLRLIFSALHWQETGFRQSSQHLVQHALERTEPAVAATTAGFQCQVHEMNDQTQQTVDSQRTKRLEKLSAPFSDIEFMMSDQNKDRIRTRPPRTHTAGMQSLQKSVGSA